jgi:hypothetical protein
LPFWYLQTLDKEDDLPFWYLQTLDKEDDIYIDIYVYFPWALLFCITFLFVYSKIAIVVIFS